MTEDTSARCQIAECLDIDLKGERWLCNRCSQDLGSAHDNYKEGCLIQDRDPQEIHAPVIDGQFTFAPDPDWCRIVEYYCPGCGILIELEYLPPGHPLTHDIEPDIEQLKIKYKVI
jgi:acetophenone carboxylase|tara:strand:- start:8533 stop:8880 length:348 start_codon:yes stop_codon:yes gene_type:complete